jgi:hypothetical protein
MVGSWKHIGNSGEKISIPGDTEDSVAPSDKQFRSTSMKAGRVRTTMEEECREVLYSVEEALAQEIQQEMRGDSVGGPGGTPGCAPPDGARIAACLHLRRAALRSVMMQRERATERERATWKPPLRRPAPGAWVN